MMWYNTWHQVWNLLVHWYWYRREVRYISLWKMLEKYIGDEDVSCIVQTVYSNCNQAKKNWKRWKELMCVRGSWGRGHKARLVREECLQYYWWYTLQPHRPDQSFQVWSWYLDTASNPYLHFHSALHEPYLLAHQHTISPLKVLPITPRLNTCVSSREQPYNQLHKDGTFEWDIIIYFC